MISWYSQRCDIHTFLIGWLPSTSTLLLWACIVVGIHCCGYALLWAYTVAVGIYTVAICIQCCCGHTYTVAAGIHCYCGHIHRCCAHTLLMWAYTVAVCIHCCCRHTLLMWGYTVAAGIHCYCGHIHCYCGHTLLLWAYTVTVSIHCYCGHTLLLWAYTVTVGIHCYCGHMHSCCVHTLLMWAYTLSVYMHCCCLHTACKHQHHSMTRCCMNCDMLCTSVLLAGCPACTIALQGYEWVMQKRILSEDTWPRGSIVSRRLLVFLVLFALLLNGVGYIYGLRAQRIGLEIHVHICFYGGLLCVESCKYYLL